MKTDEMIQYLSTSEGLIPVEILAEVICKARRLTYIKCEIAVEKRSVDYLYVWSASNYFAIRDYERPDKNMSAAISAALLYFPFGYFVITESMETHEVTLFLDDEEPIESGECSDICRAIMVAFLKGVKGAES